MRWYRLIFLYIKTQCLQTYKATEYKIFRTNLYICKIVDTFALLTNTYHYFIVIMNNQNFNRKSEGKVGLYIVIAILFGILLLGSIGVTLFFFLRGASDSDLINEMKSKVERVEEVMDSTITEDYSAVEENHESNHQDVEVQQNTNANTEEPYVIVAGDNVCLRYDASEATKMTGQQAPHFYTGDKLPYYGQSGNYYMVGWNGDTYYLPTKYGRLRGVSNQENASIGYSSVIIAGDNVCLRSLPNENTKMTGPHNPHLNTGETYPYHGAEGNYYKIEYEGCIYYLPKKYGRLR